MKITKEVNLHDKERKTRGGGGGGGASVVQERKKMNRFEMQSFSFRKKLRHWVF